MRREVVNGRLVYIIGVLLAASACTGQCGTTAKTPIKTTPLAAVPSPTPTAALQASSSPFHSGEVAVAYGAVSMTASGGVAPYKWSVSSGALPAGLNLGPDGSVAGMPTSAGSFTFTIQVADAGNSTATVPGTIGIAPALSVGLIPGCAQYCNVELGCASVCGAFGQQSGGAGPYTYTLTQGPLPSGTSLNGLSLNGTFTGASGWLQFTVQVRDALGATSSLSPKFWMYDHISLSGATCGPSRIQCTVTLPYSGGLPGAQVTAAPTAWAAGNCGFTAQFPCPEPNFSASYQPGSIKLTLTYQPNYPATFGTLTVQLTSSDPCGTASKCSSSASVKVVG